MPIDRPLWAEVMDRSNMPKLPCPRCSRGRLVARKPIAWEEPDYSAKARGTEDWEPDWITHRFAGFLYCDEPDCAEIVAVSGDTEHVEVEVEEHGWGLQEVLRPRSFFPAPPIIQVASNVPRKVHAEIASAFGLFWMDLSACANRLRTSVEYLLDDKGIPRTKISKKGKTERADLDARIRIYEAGDPEHGKSLLALKMIGNLGTHGSEITREQIFDALDIYEDALLELYGERRKKLSALKDKIISAKGQY